MVNERENVPMGKTAISQKSRTAELETVEVSSISIDFVSYRLGELSARVEWLEKDNSEIRQRLARLENK